MIASLAMYDLPWLRPANDRLWTAVARRLRDAGIAGVPDELTREADLDDLWQSRSLLLAQTCGYPLMTELRETVQIVATPRYAAEGCSGPAHRAAIVVRADHPARELGGLRGTRAGVNSQRSNSGMNLLRAAVAPLAGGRPFFERVIVTGSHARSLAGLLSGRVDVASIDAVTFAHLRTRYPRHAARIRILQWTAATPGLPLVTAASTPARTLAALREALDAAASDPDLRGTLDALRLEGYERLDIDDYRPVLALEAEAASRAYPALR